MKQPSIIAGLAGGGISGLCWWTYSGPYRWLAELQLSTFGHYYRFYTFLIVMIALSAGIDQIVRAVRRRAPGDEEASTPGWWRELESQSGNFYQMLVGGVVLLVLGTYSAWSSASSERAGLCRIPLDLLESGQERTSDWVQVSGTLLWDDCWGWGDDVSAVYYVPIVSGSWQRGDPVTAFALYTEAEADAAADFATVQGMVEQTGLPGPIEAGFEDDGPPPANASFVVNVNEAPSSNRILHFALIGLGLLMAIGSLLLYESRPEDVDVDAALARHEPDDPPPAETRRGAAPTTLMDWTPPDAESAESGCDAEVQAWLKAHNMQSGS